MRLGFKSASEGTNWVADGSPSAALRDEYPDDVVEVPQTIAGTVWDGSAWVVPVPPTLAEQRTDTRLTKEEFIAALRSLGILPHLEAAAAMRGEWPATFNTFLAGYPETVQADYQIEWIKAKSIGYFHVLLQALALDYVAAQNPGNDATANEAARTVLLDTLFGLT